MPVTVYCSECGREVVGRVVSSELIACSHLNPDDPEEDCPGSNIYAEHASGFPGDDEEPETQEPDDYGDDQDLSLQPAPRSRGRPRSVSLDMDELGIELTASDLEDLLP